MNNYFMRSYRYSGDGRLFYLSCTMDGKQANLYFSRNNNGAHSVLKASFVLIEVYLPTPHEK